MNAWILVVILVSNGATRTEEPVFAKPFESKGECEIAKKDYPLESTETVYQKAKCVPSVSS